MSTQLAAIGFGRHFRRSLLPNVIAEECLTLAAVAEVNDATRAMIHESLPGVRVTSAYREILADPSIDAVMISVDPENNASLAREALLAGKHVFVEKPMGTSADTAREIAMIAESAQRVVMTGTMWRFAPVHTVLSDWMDRERTRPTFISVNVSFPETIAREGWNLKDIEFAFYDMFIHAIDWSLSQMPTAQLLDVVQVPSTQRGRIEVCLRLRDTAGRLVVLNLVTGSSAYQISTWIHTDRGDVIEVDTKDRLRITTLPTWSGTEGWIRDRPTLNFEAGQVYRGFSRKGYAEELAEFAARIDQGRDFGTGAEQAAAALAVISAAVEAVSK